MKKNLNIFWGLPAIAIMLFASCRKVVSTGFTNLGNYTDTTSSTLKDAATTAGFSMGTVVNYSDVVPATTQYLATTVKDFNYITFGYQMKHGAVVQNDGSLNFTATDAMVNQCIASGLGVYGHTLCWYQNQNATYLNSLAAGAVTPSSTNLLANPGFELGSGSTFTNWSAYNSNGATFTSGTGSQVHSGTRSLVITNPTAHPGSQYMVQFASDLFTTVVNTTYTVTFWAMATAAGGSGRLETQYSPSGSSQYEGDQTIGTSWTQYTWTFSANATQTRILFDMGQAADTYYIDDVSVVANSTSVVPPSQAAIAAKVDSALNKFITGEVTRYIGKVKAWDVVNEPMSDGSGALRTNLNTTIPATKADTAQIYLWSQYLGRAYALKAFQYAKAADPSALLFINDYNLEASSVKLDSLLGYVKELQAGGAKIDGIGTQMHISLNASYAGIDAMFKKLAATGLKVRISELDIKDNPLNKAGYMPSAETNAYQADMYHYVIQSYLKYIPVAQRYLLTIWGVNDTESWLYNAGKQFPLPWDGNFAKKPAYSGVLQALQGK